MSFTHSYKHLPNLVRKVARVSQIVLDEAKKCLGAALCAQISQAALLFHYFHYFRYFRYFQPFLFLFIIFRTKLFFFCGMPIPVILGHFGSFW